jgi:hypothetical protein
MHPSNHGRPPRPSRTALRKALAGLAAAAVVAMVGAPAAHAEGRTRLGVSLAGVCTFVASAHAAFSPRVTRVPATVEVTINGTGSCTSNSGSSTLTISLGGSAAMSCHAAIGSMTGTLLWSNASPGPESVSVSLLGGPGSLEMVMTATNFEAAAALAWAPTDIALCPVSGTAATSLTGALVYASG